MKKTIKIIIIGLLVGTSFIGCSTKNGLSMNTMDKNQIDRYFHKGYVRSLKKVVVDNSMATMVKGGGYGLAGGAAAGSLVSSNKKNGVIVGAIAGLVIGTVSGLLTNNDIIAYETIIISDGKRYVGFMKERLNIGTWLEFTIDDGEMKNVEIINEKNNSYVSGKKIIQPNPNNDNDEIIRER